MGREQNTTGEILLYNHSEEKEFVSVVFQDETFWLAETDRFLSNNRRKVLEGKGHISREDAAKKLAISTRCSGKSRTPTTSPNLTARRRDT